MNLHRQGLNERAKCIRDEIRQIFTDAAYCNQHVSQACVTSIDLNPEGQLMPYLDAINQGLGLERKRLQRLTVFIRPAKYISTSKAQKATQLRNLLGRRMGLHGSRLSFLSYRVCSSHSVDAQRPASVGAACCLPRIISNSLAALHCML